MDNSRRFTTQVTDNTFEIIEIDPERGGVTRQEAWHQARSQDRLVTLYDLAGNVMELGIVFDPKAFEESSYYAYVRYMGDAGPATFERWAEHFHRLPEMTMDLAELPDFMRGALLLYKAMVASALASV